MTELIVISGIRISIRDKVDENTLYRNIMIKSNRFM